MYKRLHSRLQVFKNGQGNHARSQRKTERSGGKKRPTRAPTFLFFSPPLTNQRRQRAPPKNPLGVRASRVEEFSGSRSRDRFPGAAPANEAASFARMFSLAKLTKI